MPQPFTFTIRALLVSVSLIGLSACATSPDSTGIDMRSVHDRVEQARQRSIVLGSQAWQGARRLISNATRGQDDSLDEVDLALLEKDAVLPPSKFDIKRRDRWASGQPGAQRPNGEQPSQAVRIQAVPRPVAATATQLTAETSPSTPDEVANTADVLSTTPAAAAEPTDRSQRRPIIVAAQSSEDTLEGTASADSTPARIEDTEAPVAEAPAVDTPADLMHTVQAGETLWTIAKATTGDANDWHTIADINNLAPDASVRVGQDLRIPGELIDKADDTSERPAALDAITADTETEPVRTPIATLDSIDDTAVIGADTPIESADAAVEADSDGSSTPALAAVNPAAEQVFEVDAGETLWDFAKRVTGDATHWAAIAAHNGFDQRAASTVREGQSIRVPLDLLDETRPGDSRPAAAVQQAAPEPQAAVETDTPTAGDSQALKAAAAVLSNRPKSAASTNGNQPERIVEARYVEERPKQTTIQVRGTYYPKAVYRKADFSSALLMRVSPGTAMTVAGAVGPWYEVKTDKGVGYMHSRDIK